MLYKVKNTGVLISILVLTFQFFAVSLSFAQDEEIGINLQDKPVYTNLSKALRNADNVYKLNLSNKKLKEFPLDILKLKELRYLMLDSNEIAAIPPQINELKHLTLLSISHNNISEIPSSIGDLLEMKYMYIDNNQVAALPSGFFRLSQMIELFVNDNKLTAIPSEINVFKELRRLVASNNQIESLPDEIGHLYNLKRLILSHNNIKELPDHFYELTNLKALFLSNNGFTQLDSKINKLNKLEIVALDNNKFKSLPAELGELYELQDLYIEQNQLDSLPKEIANLFKLKELYFDDNPIKEIPVVYNRLTKLQILSVHGLAFKPFPQALYDIQNNGTKIVGLTGNELYNAKVLLSSARNKKLVENYPEAISKYEQLIGLDTNNVQAMSELASIYLFTSEYDKAAAICKRALSKNASQKTLDEVRATYSSSLNRTNKYDQIVNTYQSKIKADSLNAEPYFELGKFYYDQKKYEEAKVAFQKAVKVDPTHADSHFYLAVTFLDLNEPDLFIFSALRLFAIDPEGRRTKTTFPFVLTRMRMKSGVESKRGTTGYFDDYIIRNERNEIIYKSESPQADLLSAMLSDILKTGKFSDANDTADNDTDSLGENIVKEVFYTDKNNTEIFQLELARICKKTDVEIKPEEKVFRDYYVPYYSAIIESGQIETYSNIINNIRGNDPANAKWLKANADKVAKFNAWNKNYKWPK